MKSFAVIGNGKFGYYVTKFLHEKGNEVVAIDHNKDRIQSVESFTGSAVMEDATCMKTLQGLGLDEMDAVIVSTGSNIKSSILICFHLAKMGIKRIIVKAEDDDHAEILEQLGATEIIRPGRDMAHRLALRLTKPNILDYLPMEEGFTIVQIEPPPPFIGKSLKKLNLRSRYQVNIIAVKEQEAKKIVTVPHADFVIKENDILIMIGREDDIQKIKGLE
ncbi:MAG: potassium channel family protein [Desulfurivibrionaceae bacterium]